MTTSTGAANPPVAKRMGVLTLVVITVASVVSLGGLPSEAKYGLQNAFTNCGRQPGGVFFNPLRQLYFGGWNETALVGATQTRLALFLGGEFRTVE